MQSRKRWKRCDKSPENIGAYLKSKIKPVPNTHMKFPRRGKHRHPCAQQSENDAEAVNSGLDPTNSIFRSTSLSLTTIHRMETTEALKKPWPKRANK